MANIKKHIGKTGKVAWRVDYYDPGGKRVMKRFKLRRDAEGYLAKVQTTIIENQYEEVFGTKKEPTITFNELADHYQENFKHQKCYQTFKRHVVNVLREKFGAKRLTDITYLDLETFRNTWKATPIKSGTKERTDATVNRYLTVFGHLLNKAVE
jgi:hypothetical protein